MEPLAKRVASGVALAVVVVAAVALLPDAGRAAFFLVLTLVAAYEWAKLSGVGKPLGLVAWVSAIGGVLVGLWLVPSAGKAMLAVAMPFWFGALLFVVAYPTSGALGRSTAFMLAAGAVALGCAWFALTTLRPGVVLWLLAAVAAADTGAYFAGHRFGRRRLAPRVSPGKTWEGAAGGALAAVACGAVGAWALAEPLLKWLAIAAVVFVVAVVGDLFESALKRVRGVKDSGTLLPGHGGILDRVDSLLGAAPAVAVLEALAFLPS